METRYTVRQAVEMTGVKCPAILGRGTGTTDSQKRIGTPLLHRI